MHFQIFQKLKCLVRNLLILLLNKYGVAIVPGSSFGESANNFVRLSYANSIENIEKAIYRISKI